MKRKGNLSEELYKMRKLMSYDSKKDSEDVTSYERLLEEKMIDKFFFNEQKGGGDVVSKMQKALTTYIKQKGYKVPENINEIVNTFTNKLESSKETGFKRQLENLQDPTGGAKIINFRTKETGKDIPVRVTDSKSGELYLKIGNTTISNEKQLNEYVNKLNSSNANAYLNDSQQSVIVKEGNEYKLAPIAQRYGDTTYATRSKLRAEAKVFKQPLLLQVLIGGSMTTIPGKPASSENFSDTVDVSAAFEVDNTDVNKSTVNSQIQSGFLNKVKEKQSQGYTNFTISKITVVSSASNYYGGARKATHSNDGKKLTNFPAETGNVNADANNKLAQDRGNNLKDTVVDYLKGNNIPFDEGNIVIDARITDTGGNTDEQNRDKGSNLKKGQYAEIKFDYEMGKERLDIPETYSGGYRLTQNLIGFQTFITGQVGGSPKRTGDDGLNRGR